MMTENIKKLLSKTFIYALLLFTIIISIFPIIWVVMSAFKTNAQILSSPFSLPTSMSFDAFAYIFSKYNFFRYFVNSTLISVSSTVIALVFFAMGSYVLAKYEFPGKNIIFSFGLYVYGTRNINIYFKTCIYVCSEISG